MGFVPFTFIDLIDIILVAAIMYWIYRMTKGTVTVGCRIIKGHCPYTCHIFL